MDYIEAKFTASIADSLLLEYDEVLEKLSKSSPHYNITVDFQLFANKWMETLTHNPTLVPSLACNYCEGNAVTVAANQRWESGLETRPWWSWENAFPLSACALTKNVFSHLRDCCWSRDGSKLVLAGGGGCVVYDRKSMRKLSQYKAQNGAVLSCCFSRDAKLALSGGEDGEAHIWSTETGVLVMFVQVIVKLILGIFEGNIAYFLYFR